MSIGGVSSFWQDDQQYWNNQQSWASQQAASNSLINAMSSAETKLGKGLASIANQTALSRVNSQITSMIQKLLTGSTGSTSSTGTGSSSAGAATAAKPAVATGTVPLSLNTSLATLGIPAGGSIVISAGGKTTTYASTGSDTVGDILTAVNFDLPTNAQVTASLNSHGDLVLTSKNTTDMISISGIYAGNLGFAVGHQTFKPTAATGTPASASTSGAATTPKRASSSPPRSAAGVRNVSSQNASSAASLLSDSGVSGNLVNMLA